MISKKDFLAYCERVQKTEQGIQRIEDALGNICLREQNFCSIPNYVDKIAVMLLTIPKEYEESFIIDFWNTVDTGKSEVCITFESGDEEVFTIKGFGGLYDYYKKEIGNDN